MKNLTRLIDLQSHDVYDIFNIADKLSIGKYSNFLNEKTAVLFFPPSSIRTRITFE